MRRFAFRWGQAPIPPKSGRGGGRPPRPLTTNRAHGHRASAIGAADVVAWLKAWRLWPRRRHPRQPFGFCPCARHESASRHENVPAFRRCAKILRAFLERSWTILENRLFWRLLKNACLFEPRDAASAASSSRRTRRLRARALAGGFAVASRPALRIADAILRRISRSRRSGCSTLGETSRHARRAWVSHHVAGTTVRLRRKATPHEVARDIRAGRPVVLEPPPGYSPLRGFCFGREKTLSLKYSRSRSPYACSISRRILLLKPSAEALLAPSCRQ